MKVIDIGAGLFTFVASYLSRTRPSQSSPFGNIKTSHEKYRQEIEPMRRRLGSWDILIREGKRWISVTDGLQDNPLPS